MGTTYAGRLRGRLESGGLEVVETSYRSEQRVERHAHDRPMLIVVLRGSMTEHACRRSVRYRPGTVAFHPAGEPHAHTFGGSASRCLSLQIGDGWGRRLSVTPDRMPSAPTARIDRSATGAARLLHAEFRRGEDASATALDGLVLSILGALTRDEPTREKARPRFLDAVLEKLHDDVGGTVRLDALATLAGVSPEHLARTFRAREGVTIGEYARRLRVERARAALAEGDRPLSRIALDLGFCDQSHFTRTFKAHVGCTPGEYRRRGPGPGG